MALYLRLNNQHHYLYLLPEGEDFYIPEIPLLKVEVYLPNLYEKDIDTDEIQEAIQNLMWCNKGQDRAFLTSAIIHNLKIPKEHEEEVTETIRTHYKSFESGELKPIETGRWHVITRRGFNGSGKYKTWEEQHNNQKIEDAISYLKKGRKKITQQSVVDITKLSLRTIKSRWSSYKVEVKEFNAFIKELDSYKDVTDLENEVLK